MNYRIFEDNGNPYVYKQSGWDFINQYIQWAKQYDMYLILDMHVAPGGLQNGSAAPVLWGDPVRQKRTAALWYEIASRYKNDTTIAGFDLLNEPTPVDSIEAYSNLVQRIADTIRTVDTNHLIIVEYAYGLIDTNNNWYPWWDLSQQMFLINDNNTMYDFHYYAPLQYTLQCYNDTSCIPTIQYTDTSQHFTTEAGNNLPFNKEWLREDLEAFASIYKNANIPINIGEWAPWRANYEYNNNEMKGFDYICDLLQLFDQNDINWQYYCYAEFRPTSQSPNGNDELNQKLKNYFIYNQCDTIADTTVSVIHENDKNNPFNLYPNPVENSFHIALDAESKNVEVHIFNVMGQLEYADVISDGKYIIVNIKMLLPGLYFAKIKTADLNRTITLVKQ